MYGWETIEEILTAGPMLLLILGTRNSGDLPGTRWPSMTCQPCLTLPWNTLGRTRSTTWVTVWEPQHTWP